MRRSAEIRSTGVQLVFQVSRFSMVYKVTGDPPSFSHGFQDMRALRRVTSEIMIGPVGGDGGSAKINLK